MVKIPKHKIVDRLMKPIMTGIMELSGNPFTNRTLIKVACYKYRCIYINYLLDLGMIRKLPRSGKYTRANHYTLTDKGRMIRELWIMTKSKLNEVR
jgi:hypothetical protein